MTDTNEDDKPTVVLDLNNLKKQKVKQEEELANLASSVEFNIPEIEETQKPSEHKNIGHKVILFDFQSHLFESSKEMLPPGHEYKIVKDLAGLNECLKQKIFQIVVFNYDANPKAVNQLCAQIKAKFPHTKTLILAKAISPEKAALHAKTASGAHGYLRLPIEAVSFEREIQKILANSQKAA